MNSILTVTTPAADLSLLTLAELQVATGVTDGSQVTALQALGRRVAAALAGACRVAAAGAQPPTLRQETLTEVYRLDRERLGWHDRGRAVHKLFLSRRPVVSVGSVIEDGTTLDPADYEADLDAGLLYRLSNDRRTAWRACKTTVVYDAGWAIVPDDLKLAAAKTANLFWSENGPNPRDPNLKSVEVVGVSVRQYWVSPSTDALLPQDIVDLLGRFTNILV